MSEEKKTKKIGKWYFGGVASAGAACCTHPLDLLKVHLQTQQSGKIGLVQMGVKVFKSDGIFGLYNGLTASLLRQFTYSMTRFGIYETVKKNIDTPDRPMVFYEKVLLGGVAGCAGGFVGTPADLINVRMQNDVKLAPDQRRNYKHAIDGLYRVVKTEGPIKLMNGATMASSRATLVTIGQLSFYDQFKVMLLRTSFFKDNITTHFTASFLALAAFQGNTSIHKNRLDTATSAEMSLVAKNPSSTTYCCCCHPLSGTGGVATLITMPLDVMKTRMMNAPPGTYSNILACAKDVASAGPMGFFKGFIPAFVRLGPHTILTFIFFEQLRLRFGDTVPA